MKCAGEPPIIQFNSNYLCENIIGSRCFVAVGTGSNHCWQDAERQDILCSGDIFVTTELYDMDNDGASERLTEFGILYSGDNQTRPLSELDHFIASGNGTTIDRVRGSHILFNDNVCSLTGFSSRSLIYPNESNAYHVQMILRCGASILHIPAESEFAINLPTHNMIPLNTDPEPDINGLFRNKRSILNKASIRPDLSGLLKNRNAVANEEPRTDYYRINNCLYRLFEIDLDRFIQRNLILDSCFTINARISTEIFIGNEEQGSTVLRMADAGIGANAIEFYYSICQNTEQDSETQECIPLNEVNSVSISLPASPFPGNTIARPADHELQEQVVTPSYRRPQLSTSDVLPLRPTLDCRRGSIIRLRRTLYRIDGFDARQIYARRDNADPDTVDADEFEYRNVLYVTLQPLHSDGRTPNLAAATLVIPADTKIDGVRVLRSIVNPEDLVLEQDTEEEEVEDQSVWTRVRTACECTSAGAHATESGLRSFLRLIDILN